MIEAFVGSALLGSGLFAAGWQMRKPKDRTRDHLREVFENTGLMFRKHNRILRPLIIREEKVDFGYRLFLSLPEGLCLEDFQARKPEIEQAVNGEIELERTKNGYLRLDVMSHALANRINFSYPEFPDNLALPILIGHSRAGVEIRDLIDFPHLLVAGETYGGKSNFLHVMIVCLAHNPNVRLCVVDMAKVEFSYLRRYAWTASTLAEATKVLEFLDAEMRRRMNAMARAKAVKIQDYKGDDMPYYVLVVDEFSQLAPVLAKGDKEEKKAREHAHGLLVNLLCLARKVGIHVVLCTQRPDKDILPGQLKANIPATIAFKVRNKVNSEICLDNGHADRLPRIKGRGVFQFDVEREIQVPWLPVDKARALLPEKPLTRPVLPRPKHVPEVVQPKVDGLV